MDSVYQKYAKTVYRYLLSLTGDGQLSEELTQETFYQAIRSSSRFDESCKVSTWLCGIARNTYRTWKRKNPPTEAIDGYILERASLGTSSSGTVSLGGSSKGAAFEETASPGGASQETASPGGASSGTASAETDSAENQVLKAEERLNLFRSLHLLEDPFREVMYLRFFGDLSFREIGEVFGKKENWARVTFFRGKEKLKKMVQEHMQ